jgi:hypothetical protein
MLVSGAILAGSGSTAAQAPGSVRGFIRDPSHRALANAEVLLAGVPRSVTTNAAGYFVFDSLPARDYRLTARLPGFAPRRLLVGVEVGRPTELDLVLEPVPHVLDSVVVVSTRRGLYGVVGDSARQPIAGAQVRVYGGNARQVTDSTGRFAFPAIKMGAYLVEATHPGLVGKPLHVSVPSRGSREVVLFLLPTRGGRNSPPGQRWVYHDLGMRLSFHPASSRLPREGLARHGSRQLCDIAMIRATVAEYLTIWVDGVQELKEWPLCSFSADELSLIELTCASPAARPRFSARFKSKCIRVWTR